MDQTFTLDDLSKFHREEKSILKSLGLLDDMSKLEEAPQKLEPRKETIDHILNYSRALSVRTSKLLGNMEMILN